MSLLLSHLPLEVQWQIAELIPHEDLASSASTSKHFRDVLISRLFRTIFLENNEGLADEMASLSTFHARQHAQTSFFLATSRDDMPSIEETYKDKGIKPPMLYEAVKYLLGNLSSLFPRLVNLSIDFHFDGLMDISEGCAYAEYTQHINTNGPIASDVFWQSLVSEVYEALLGCPDHGNPNENAGQISNLAPNLQILGFLAYEAPIFSDPLFRRALGSLKQFAISIRSPEYDTEGFPIWETSEYSRVMNKLDQIFFDHLISVESLRLSVDALGILGPEVFPPDPSGHLVGLPLKPHHMPLLRNLELDTIIIGSYLFDFLKAHSESLLRITLKNCYAGSRAATIPESVWETEGGDSAAKSEWADLFYAISEHHAQSLKSFDVSPAVICLFNHDGSSTGEKYERYFACFDPEWIRYRSQSKDFIFDDAKQVRRIFPYAKRDSILPSRPDHPPIEIYKNLIVAALLFGRDQ